MTVIFLPIIKTVLQSSTSVVRFMVTQLSAKQKISCLGQGLKERKTKKRYVCTKNPRQQSDLSKQLGLKPGRTTAPCAAPEGTHQPAECRNFCYLRVHEEPWKSARSLWTTGLTGLGSALRFLLLWPKQLSSLEVSGSTLSSETWASSHSRTDLHAVPERPLGDMSCDRVWTRLQR